jgi:nucleotide-binding universal stress UspA family protein
MFKNIMLAVDGSAYADSVLSHGIALAKAFQSKIHVITVADIRVFEWVSAVGTDGFVPIVPSIVYQNESRKILDEKSSRILEKCAGILSAEGMDFEAEKILGSPMDSIAGRSQISDLLVMGKRGEFERWEERAIGATLEAVSRKVRKPLLAVGKAYVPIKNILAAYDGSSHANQALQFIGHLAEATSAEVTVLCVSEDKALGNSCNLEAADYLKNYKITLKLDVVAGHPDKEIVGYALRGYDLIAIGAFGHSRIREALLGSTTEHILRFATTPVLLAR